MSNFKYKYMYLYTLNCLSLMEKNRFNYFASNVEFFVAEENAINSCLKNENFKKDNNYKEVMKMLHSGRIIKIPYIQSMMIGGGLIREMIAHRKEGAFITLFGYRDEGTLSIFKEVVKFINEQGGEGYLLQGINHPTINVLTNQQVNDLDKLSNGTINKTSSQELKVEEAFGQGYAIAVDEDDAEEGVSVIVLDDEDDSQVPHIEPEPEPIYAPEIEEEPLPVEEPSIEEAPKEEKTNDSYEDPFMVSTSSAPEVEETIAVEEVKEEPVVPPEIEEPVQEEPVVEEITIEEESQEETIEEPQIEESQVEPEEENKEETPVEDDLDPFFKGFDF